MTAFISLAFISVGDQDDKALVGTVAEPSFNPMYNVDTLLLADLAKATPATDSRSVTPKVMATSYVNTKLNDGSAAPWKLVGTPHRSRSRGQGNGTWTYTDNASHRPYSWRLTRNASSKIGTSELHATDGNTDAQLTLAAYIVVTMPTSYTGAAE